MKSSKLIVLCVCLLVFLSGCATSAEDVKLKDKNQILSYVLKEYGKAIYVKEKASDSSITYTLKDSQHKFLYECKSRAYQVSFDATETGFYSEQTNCDFDENYRKYILKKLNLNNIVESNVSNNDLGEALFGLSFNEEDLAKKQLKKLVKKIKRIDSRNYFEDYYIDIYNNSGEYLGCYSIKLEEYYNLYEQKVDKMTRNFSYYVNNDYNNSDGINYSHYVRVQFNDIVGFKMEWLDDKDKKSDDFTTLYVFDYYGKTYYVMDERVDIVGDSEINGSHRYKYFTDYWFK